MPVETKMKIGDILKRRAGGNNLYEVLEIDNWELVLLKCVWFGGKEDLGDLIFCTREEQEIWVAMYFARHYELVTGDN